MAQPLQPSCQVLSPAGRAGQLRHMPQVLGTRRWACAAYHRQPQQGAEAVLERRTLLLGTLGLLAAGSAATPTGSWASSSAAEPAGAATPPLEETFMSSQGFRFNHPSSWVVAFDRSSSSGNGAVVVVGDYRNFITTSVFRTDLLAEATKQQGLDEESGYALCVDPQQRDPGTMRFKVLDSSAVAGSYQYEYVVESCGGEIQEALGGKLLCLGPMGQELDTLTRHHVGKSIIINGVAFIINASLPQSSWEEARGVLTVVVASFRG